MKGRIENLLDYYEENQEMAIGVEKVKKREAKARFLAMSSEERAQIIAWQGLAQTLKLFKARGGNV